MEGERVRDEITQVDTGKGSRWIVGKRDATDAMRCDLGITQQINSQGERRGYRDSGEWNATICNTMRCSKQDKDEEKEMKQQDEDLIVAPRGGLQYDGCCQGMAAEEGQVSGGLLHLREGKYRVSKGD